MTEDQVGIKLATLAQRILDAALVDGVGLEDQLDAFKVVTAYYVNTTKINARRDQDEDEGVGFDSYQQRIASSAGRR